MCVCVCVFPVQVTTLSNNSHEPHNVPAGWSIWASIMEREGLNTAASCAPPRKFIIYACKCACFRWMENSKLARISRLMSGLLVFDLVYQVQLLIYACSIYGVMIWMFHFHICSSRIFQNIIYQLTTHLVGIRQTVFSPETGESLPNGNSRLERRNQKHRNGKKLRNRQLQELL
jgi:hypothetical protein